MLLYDAEQQNSALNADTKLMENFKALNEMKDLESQDSLSFGAVRKVPGRGLPALGAQVSDPGLQKKVTILNEENQQMKQKMNQLTQQLTQALAAKTQIGEEMEKKLTLQTESSTKKQSEVRNLEEELEETTAQNAKLKQELVNVN